MRASAPVFVLGVVLGFSTSTSLQASEYEFTDPLEGAEFLPTTDVSATGHATVGTPKVRVLLQIKDGMGGWAIVSNQVVTTTNNGQDWTYNFGPQTVGDYKIELRDFSTGDWKDDVLIFVVPEPE